MDDNVMRVLQMLQDGKISAQEAETLIAALRGESSQEKKPEPAAEAAADKPFMEDFRAKLKAQKIDLDLEHLGEKISRAVSKVQPEKIVAKVQAQLRSATRSGATWGASVSARVRNWASGVDARPVNSGALPEHTETQEQQVHLEAGANVLVENPLGNVKLTAGAEDTAVVVINKTVWGPADSHSAIAESMIVNIFATDNRLDVKVSAPDQFRDGVLDLELRVPATASTRTSTRFGAIDASGLAGRLEAATTTGNMRVADVSGDARGETTAGNIVIERVNGSVTVATQSGDISAQEIRGGLSANSSSGDVSAQNIEGGRLECKSVSGDVSVKSIGAAAPLDIVVESLSGDASLIGASGNVAIKAVSGDINADDLIANRVQAQTVSGDVHVKIHAPFSGTAQINTVSGDVELGLPADTNARVSLASRSAPLPASFGAITTLREWWLPTRSGQVR